jgi:hypothetical protein
MKTYEQIIKRLDMQIEHCKDCQDTDGQLKGFIEGLQSRIYCKVSRVTPLRRW